MPDTSPSVATPPPRSSGRERVRILYHHRIVADDGMRVHVNAIVNALRGAGHEVEVVGPTASGEGGSLTARVAGFRQRMPAWMGELLEIAYNLPTHRRLQAALRKFRPDVIYERHNLFLLSGAWARKRLGIPLILEVNAPLAVERAAYGRLALRRLARRMEADVWRRADAVLPVSDALADHLRGAGVPEDRIHVVPNAVPRPTVVASGSSAAATRHAPVTFGFVGFARSWHGLDRVLEVLAARTEMDMRLLIVGDGPALPALSDQARRLGIENKLTFTGAVEHTAIPGCLAQVSVALQPDVTPYASPLKLFEYMAAGCAIIAPDRANIREILEHERTALLFDPHTPGAFAAAVDQLAGDAALRRRLGEAAAATVRERDMTWEGNAARIAEIATELVEKTASPTNATTTAPMQRTEGT
ncbi:hypothetical protein CKO28_13005 [Rhodovibrio sodomensis]|uniref:Glycosyltransferase WbuB n=1 Tax=Rhodovibrio sodomensis TaxID=1088 RepID=A0ABS1DES5_9PROT|nr:glycosyltransferase family 4 protein [Rhodovibrio sodomensis]MBK1668950.1 hypothetical protein [Rhodovibrio sodomensis]